jgi:hypothetical protein
MYLSSTLVFILLLASALAFPIYTNEAPEKRKSQELLIFFRWQYGSGRSMLAFIFLEDPRERDSAGVKAMTTKLSKLIALLKENQTRKAMMRTLFPTGVLHQMMNLIQTMMLPVSRQPGSPCVSTGFTGNVSTSYTCP